MWGVDPKKSGASQAAQISRCLVNEDGSQLYPRDVVEQWPTEVVLAVLKAINEVNRASAETVKAAEGNSDATAASVSATS